MYQQDHTCCKCNVRGLPVQIHHIDEDPSNNDPSNLAVLCSNCHDGTMISGGFGRKLNAPLVTQYRDEWIKRVANRRDEADKLAASAMSGAPKAVVIATDPETYEDSETDYIDTPFERPDEDDLLHYVEELPSILNQAFRFTDEKRASGITLHMNDGAAEIVDVLEQILLRLSYWFPSKHFDGKPAAEFFSKYVADRFTWHRALAEPYGEGTGGTIRGQIILGGVIDDLEDAVADVVAALLWGPDSTLDVEAWTLRWKKSGTE